MELIKISIIKEQLETIELYIESRNSDKESLESLDKVCSAISSGPNAIEFGYLNSSLFRVILKV